MELNYHFVHCEWRNCHYFLLGFYRHWPFISLSVTVSGVFDIIYPASHHAAGSYNWIKKIDCCSVQCSVHGLLFNPCILVVFAGSRFCVCRLAETEVKFYILYHHEVVQALFLFLQSLT